MRRAAWVWVALSGVAACTEDEHDASQYIVPADGQSAVSADEPLRVRLSGLVLADDGRDLIRVVDLSADGFVAGSLSSDDGVFAFTPDHPWRRGRRYAWTVDVPESLPHGPQYATYEDLAEPAVFDTSDALYALAGARHEGETCVVLSRALGSREAESLRIEVDGRPVDDVVLSVLSEDVWRPQLNGADDRPALGVACADLGDIDALRISDDENTALIEVSDASIVDIINALYRSVP